MLHVEKTKQEEGQSSNQDSIPSVSEQGPNVRDKRSRTFFDKIREAQYTKGKRELEHCASLIYRFYLTSGTRFETARRHKKKHRTSNIAIIILSFYAILFSMITTFTKTADESKELLSLLSVFMSSFVVAVAIYESSKRYDVRSELFLRCASEVQALRDRAVVMLLSEEASWQNLSEMEAEYQRILTIYNDNHSNLDFNEFRLNIGKFSENNWIKVFHRARYTLDIWMFPLMAAVSPFVILFIHKIIRYFV